MSRLSLTGLLGTSHYFLAPICLAFLFISNVGDARIAENVGSTGLFLGESKDWANPVTGELFNTPKQACDDFIKGEFPGKNYQTKLEPAGNGDINIRRCLYFADGTWSFKGTVSRIGICTTTASGLYSDLDASENFTAEFGKDFDEQNAKQKTKIRQRNIDMNGFLKSDDPDDPCPYLCRATQAQGGVEKDLCEVEIDHIIPRISNGEPCGSNAYSNARVTSKKLNNAKRNNPDFDAKTLPKITPKCEKVTNLSKPDVKKPPLSNSNASGGRRSP